MRVNRGYYDVFVRTCAKYASSVAVRYYSDGKYKHYTYSEMYGVCEYISQNLQQLKCNRCTIGLISERNIVIPCIIAAAHKCCTTFMFIDPSQDLEVVTNVISFTIIVTIKTKEIDGTSELLGKKPDKTISVFDLEINFFYCNAPENQFNNNVNQYSYIATTSGSTGDPKHIRVPIQCIQPNIDDLTALFNITHHDVIYFSTPLTFDPSMVEILLACQNGASLLIAPEKVDVLFPVNQENSITIWQTTPSKFFQYSNTDIKNKILSAGSTLKALALGGEPFNGIKRLRELKDSKNNTKIFTLYGVTEMSCWACAAELDLDKALTDREVPLGNCLSETELIIEQVKESKYSGKLILVSNTRNCFILNKLRGLEAPSQNSLKFIDTGDFGEMRNGTIYYRGRKDDIIKRFGHKINLQLIESTIMQCPRVKTCSCIWLPKPLLLVVYFSSETLNSQELSDFLKCKLDDKHWPDKVVRVDNLLTNSHGKISKILLSRLYEKNCESNQSLSIIKTNFLKELKMSLCRNFTYDQIKDKDFFSIGGTSFLALSLCNKLSLINPQFGKCILPFLMSQKYTIEEILLMAQKEMCVVAETKPKKRMKRCRSKTESFNDCTSKKTNDTVYKPVDFSVAWTFDTGKCVDASPTLFKTDLNIFVTVGSHSGKVIVMDAIGGTLQGLISIKSRVEASVLCYSDSEVSPRGVVGAYNGTVVCFDLVNCKEYWRINIKSMIKSKAAYCKGAFYIASYDGNVRSIDVMTGNIIDTISIADQAISADLVVAKNEYVLLGTLSGICASIHLVTKLVVWRSTLGSPVFASPVLYDADKYVVFAEVNGEIHCRTVEKGIKIWKYQGAKGNIFSSLYIREVDKLKWQVVFGCHDGKIYSINIKNFQPSLYWKATLTSPVYATPCGLSDRFILAASNNGKLVVIELDSGVVIAEYPLPNETFSSPAVYGDYIFIGCRNDHIFSLKYSLNL